MFRTIQIIIVASQKYYDELEKISVYIVKRCIFSIFNMFLIHVFVILIKFCFETDFVSSKSEL